MFEISIFPFSFAEYLQYHDSSDPDGSFDSYVRDGGMSGSYLYRTYENAMKYVKAIYETTIAKDIIKKFRVQNEDMLLRIGNFLMDNVGSLTSISHDINLILLGLCGKTATEKPAVRNRMRRDRLLLYSIFRQMKRSLRKKPER